VPNDDGDVAMRPDQVPGNLDTDHVQVRPRRQLSYVRNAVERGKGTWATRPFCPDIVILSSCSVKCQLIGRVRAQMVIISKDSTARMPDDFERSGKLKSSGFSNVCTDVLTGVHRATGGAGKLDLSSTGGQPSATNSILLCVSEPNNA
jgi:hypothetical protein